MSDWSDMSDMSDKPPLPLQRKKKRTSCRHEILLQFLG